jgi:hypothetical protein
MQNLQCLLAKGVSLLALLFLLSSFPARWCGILNSIKIELDIAVFNHKGGLGAIVEF